jgi:hypothetical protein
MLALLQAAPGEGGVAALGPPSVRVDTGGASAEVWLQRTGDTVGIRCWIPDSTPSWDDEMIVSLDVAGDAAPRPRHDDFQWALRRALDSSVVYRGRDGRWEPPRNDPDWRLGPEHSGGGWTVEAAERDGGWWLLLRLEGTWLAGESGRAPRLGLRVRDAGSSAWAAWPPPGPGAHPSAVEGSPAHWAPLTGSLLQTRAPP